MSEVKLLTEADFDKLWDVRRERKVLYAFLRERGLIAPEPVDPVRLMAVQIMDYLNPQGDDHDMTGEAA